MTETPLGAALPDALALVAGRAPHHQMRLERFDQERGLLLFQMNGEEGYGSIPVDLLGTCWTELPEDERVSKVDFLLQALRIRQKINVCPENALTELAELLRPLLFPTDALPTNERPVVDRALLPPIYSVVLGLQLDGLTVPLSATASGRWGSEPDVLFQKALENLKGDSFRREESDEGLVWFGGNAAAAALMDLGHWFDIPDRGMLVRPLNSDLLMLLPIYPWTLPAIISLMFQVELPLPDSDSRSASPGEPFVPVWCSPAGVLEAPSGVARTPCGERFHVPGPRAMRAVYLLR